MAKTYLTANIARSPAVETLSRHITAPLGLLVLPGCSLGTLHNLVAMLREEAAAGKHAAVDALDQVEVMLRHQGRQRKAA